MSQASEFFDARYADGVGLAVIVLKGASGELTQSRYFRWPAQREEILAFVERHKHEDVYTCNGLMKTERRTKAAVKWLSSVQCDVDAFDPALLHLTPSEIVHTSEGRTHAHWDITDCNDPSLIEQIAHAVSVAHPKGEDGVDFGWARNKVIRVPGSVNLKYGEPQEVWSEKTGLVYTFAEFAEAYPPVPTAAPLVESKERGPLPSKAEALKSITAPTSILNELLDPTEARKSLARGTDPSNLRFKLENELIRCGASDEAMYVILSEHPFRSKKTDSDLWSDILRARAKANAEVDPEVAPNDEVVTVEPPAVPKSVDFLTQEEKDSLQSNFITEYLAWATSRTDAYAGYHVAGAFETLSVVFSDHGHAVTSFAPKGMPLNLWFMVLGDTTRSRKSTARNFMRELLHELEDDTYHYDLASDFTGEALDNALLDRPHRSALVHVDEFQGFLEAANQKAYLAGIKGKLAELYDGYANGKLRATGLQQQKRTTRVSFCFFAMGIRDQVADVMDQHDFQSGFLARFLYVQAEPPKRVRGKDQIRQPDRDTVEKGDDQLRGIVEGLREGRQFWEDQHEPGSPTVPVPFHDKALKRLNEFRDDLLDAAEGQERHEILMATSERMAINLMKAATLLAMSECCDEVQLRHVLTVIAYGAEWFEHMVFMANKIASSAFRRTQGQVMEFIGRQGGTATKAQIHRKFRDMPMSQILHTLDALRESGLILTDVEDAKIIHLTEMGLSEIKKELAAA